MKCDDIGSEDHVNLGINVEPLATDGVRGTEGVLGSTTRLSRLKNLVHPSLPPRRGLNAPSFRFKLPRRFAKIRELAIP
jgi:hypothetical protein